ncbi:MAG: hypothetical protein NPIRA05_10910 [Nitrospirales bacterium]|nr:MAG: hypothetical protein NPIRA05_10910 [Nitrospirales bacterium]
MKEVHESCRICGEYVNADDLSGEEAGPNYSLLLMRKVQYGMTNTVRELEAFGRFISK